MKSPSITLNFLNSSIFIQFLYYIFRSRNKSKFIDCNHGTTQRHQRSWPSESKIVAGGKATSTWGFYL